MIRHSSRQGMALLLVSMVIVLVALAAYGYLDHMQSQYRLAKMQLEQTEAKQTAFSGLEFCSSLLDRPGQLRQSLGSLEDNVAIFGERILVSDPSNAEADSAAWRFSVISPKQDTSNANRAANATTLPFRYGMENESAKLHIPTLLEWDKNQPGSARRALLNLPGANDELVTIFLEYCRAPQQSPKQATAPDRIASVWNGGDWNRNYRLDAFEQQLASLNEGRAADNVESSASDLPQANTSWQQYLTWEGGQRNVNWNGQPRIFLNQSDLQKLHRELMVTWPDTWANYVILARQYGVTTKPGNLSAGSAEVIPPPDFNFPAKFTLRSPLDLIDTIVRIPSESGSATAIVSPFLSEMAQQSDYLGKLLDDVTTTSSEHLTGVVDVNSAPVEVLQGIPGMTSSIAQRCVQVRQSQTTSPTSETYHIGWLLTQSVCNLQTLKQLYPYLAARSDVYQVQVIGYRDDLSPTFRASAIIDGRVSPTRVRHFQHWQNWGRF
jgi:hypothetical protein